MLHSKQAEAVQVLPWPQLSLYSLELLPVPWLGTAADGRTHLTPPQVARQRQGSRWGSLCLRKHAHSASRSATHKHDVSSHCFWLCPASCCKVSLCLKDGNLLMRSGHTLVIVQICGRHTAAESHCTAASTSNYTALLPPPSSQSDAIVHFCGKSAGPQPNSHSLTSSTATDVQSSSKVCPQLGSPHRPSATNSGCTPSILPFSSSARKSGRTQTGVGDTLSGFLQEQAKPPHVDPQVVLPQPASGTRDLFVDMVTADFTFLPSPGQQHCNSSNKTETQHNARQGPTTSPNCPPATTSFSSAPGSVGVSGMCSGCTPADRKQEQQGAGTAVPQSMKVSVGDLTNGAVMLQNPDGSVQYVVLTSDEQRAVQLSMQARHHKEAGTAETSAYQVLGYMVQDRCMQRYWYCQHVMLSCKL